MAHLLSLAEGDKFNWQDYHKMKERDFGIGETIYTQVEWEVSYYESASNFLSETMPKLWKIGKPSEVRCVYWFDN